MLKDVEFNIAQPRSAAERVCENLRESILSRKIEPGERLVEAKIAHAMNVSITPVRQAIQTLSTQGLLTVFPYKGTYVTYITKEYVEDVQYARLLLEVGAAKLALPHLTAEDADLMEEICRKGDEAYRNGDIYASVQYDIAMHELPIRKSGNALLLDMWEITKSRIQIVQANTKVGVHPVGYYLERHKPIIAAVRARDLDTLTAALDEHFRTSPIQSGVDFPSESEIEYN